MEPEKFENKVKRLLEEREIKPSAQSWERLERRLEQKVKVKKPYLWFGAAAAIAVIFFTLGAMFTKSTVEDVPQLVEEAAENNVLEGKTEEPEILQVAASEERSEEKKSLAERPAKKTILEASVTKATGNGIVLASENASDAPEVLKPENVLSSAERNPQKIYPQLTSEVTDTEVEALLLLATTELDSNSGFTVDSKDLLLQVEYELDQSFRQKVFEVVKEGLSRAKTAVANREF